MLDIHVKTPALWEASFIGTTVDATMSLSPRGPLWGKISTFCIRPFIGSKTGDVLTAATSLAE